MSETIYAKGLYGNLPKEGSPDFVIGKLSFKTEEFKAFLDENTNEKGYVSIDLTKGKEGRISAKLNTYKPRESNNISEENPF